MSRAKLAAVVKSAGDVMRIADAAESLHVSRLEAAKTLARWAQQGWVQRVGPGRYVPVTLAMTNSGPVVEDAWVLVPALFGPAYIGGWSAAEHWDLTEQIFRDILVFTALPIRSRKRRSGGAEFALRRVPDDKFFGTKVVWRGQTKVMVSDLERTMVDMLDDPSVGGGIQHVDECLDRYLRHAEADPKRLLVYADRLSNGAIFKRLGFLAERHPRGAQIVAACRTRLTQGRAKLDPALGGERLITRWRLRVPKTWQSGPKSIEVNHDR